MPSKVFVFAVVNFAAINPTDLLRMFVDALPEPLRAHRSTMINALKQQLLKESGNVLKLRKCPQSSQR